MNASREARFWIWVVGLLGCAAVSMSGCASEASGPEIARCVERCEKVKAEFHAASTSWQDLHPTCYCKYSMPFSGDLETHVIQPPNAPHTVECK